MTIQTGYAIASKSALKALSSSQRADSYARLVKSVGWYMFDASSGSAADDDLILMPDDNPSFGRWIKIGGSGGGGSGGGGEEESAISGTITCTTGATVSNSGKVFEFSNYGSFLLTIAVASGVTINSGSNKIIVHQWTQEPNIEQFGKIETRLATFGSTGGGFVITVVSGARWITLGAKHPGSPSNDYSFDVPYITRLGNILTIVGF